jgi:ABC-type spermidine/putrescine transport system permease subunit II
VLAFFYVPIGLVVANSVNADESLDEWGGFTLHWFGDIFGDHRVRSDFGTSVTISAVTMLASVLLALSAVLAAGSFGPRAKAMLNATTYARLMLPEVVVAVGLFLLLRRLDWPLGIVPVIIGHVVFCSAYATIVIQARYGMITGRYAEAAADLGASPWRTFRRVTAPLLTSSLIVAGLLAFTFSFDDVVSSVFLSGSSTETLPMLMLGLVRQRVTPQVNAIAVSVMVITLITLAVVAAATSIRSAAGVSAPPEEATADRTKESE